MKCLYQKGNLVKLEIEMSCLVPIQCPFMKWFLFSKMFGPVVRVLLGLQNMVILGRYEGTSLIIFKKFQKYIYFFSEIKEATFHEDLDSR